MMKKEIVAKNKNQNKISISFLIATKNAEKTIKSCLTSVLKVMHSEDEIIVCDCSNDKTKEIIKTLSGAEPITIVGSEEKGIYQDRLKLLSLAKCQYFYFVDADDTIIANNFEKMREGLNESKCDICYFDSCVKTNSLIEYKKLFPQDSAGQITKEAIVDKAISTYDLNALWNGVYALKLTHNFVGNAQRQAPNFGEDRHIALACCKQASSFFYFPENCYEYCLNGKGESANIKASYLIDYLLQLDDSFAFMEAENLPNQKRKLFFKTIGEDTLINIVVLCYFFSTSKQDFLDKRRMIQSSNAFNQTFAQGMLLSKSRSRKYFLRMFQKGIFFFPKTITKIRHHRIH